MYVGNMSSRLYLVLALAATTLGVCAGKQKNGHDHGKAAADRHHVLTLMDRAQTIMSEIRQEVGNQRYTELQAPLQERIDQILDDVNFHLEKAVKQDRMDTQKVIDASLSRLQAKTRLAVELKLGADMADSRAGGCRADEAKLLAGSLAEYEKLGALRREKTAKCNARDAARNIELTDIVHKSTCDLLTDYECAGVRELEAEVSKIRVSVLEQMHDFKKKSRRASRR